MGLGFLAVLFAVVAIAWNRRPAHWDAVAVAPSPPADAAVAPPALPAAPPLRPSRPPTVPVTPPTAPVAPPPSPTPPPPPDAPAAPPEQSREETLKKAVEQHLQEASPNPAGVGDCIDLGVLYLDRSNFSDAEALFTRMDDAGPPRRTISSAASDSPSPTP